MTHKTEGFLILVFCMGIAGGLHCEREEYSLKEEELTPNEQSPSGTEEELLSRAEELRRNDRYQKAFQHYRAVLQEDSENRSALIGLAKMALQMDEPESAVSLARNVAQKHPEDPVVLNLLGVTYVATGKYKKAGRAFDRALQQDPENLRILSNATQFALERGEEEKARSYAKRMSEVNPEMAQPWILIGRSFVQEGKFKEAIQPLKKAIERDSENGRVYYHLGRVFRRLNREQQAKEQFREALKRNPPPRLRRLMEDWID